jgi:phage terminase small subunit
VDEATHAEQMHQRLAALKVVDDAGRWLLARRSRATCQMLRINNLPASTALRSAIRVVESTREVKRINARTEVNVNPSDLDTSPRAIIDARLPPSVFPESVARDGLTPLQRRFAVEYLVDMNATAAAIRAGYRPLGAAFKGHRLLHSPKIRALIEAEAQKTIAIPQPRIIAELARIAFANMLDYICVQPDGTAYVDLSKLTREQAAAIGSVEVEEYTEGRGVNARAVKRVKLKLASKLDALEKLARLFGMFTDKVEHTGKDGAPLIPENSASPRDLARAIMDIFRSAATENTDARIAPGVGQSPPAEEDDQAVVDDAEEDEPDVDSEERDYEAGATIPIPGSGRIEFIVYSEADGRARWSCYNARDECFARIWGKAAAIAAVREVKRTGTYTPDRYRNGPGR